MWLGTSTLPPGQRGAINIGHKVSQEVFSCCKRHVLLRGARHLRDHQSTHPRPRGSDALSLSRPTRAVYAAQIHKRWHCDAMVP
jgi:hypothetical protein